MGDSTSSYKSDVSIQRMTSTMPQFETPHKRVLAYRYHKPRTGRTFVWLSGFMSDMEGTKVQMLEAWAVDNQEGFLAFDYSGHGASDGSFSDGSISQWREDVLDIITGLTDGPLVLVGSSMGGWLALLATECLSARVQALVLIAPAPDFTSKLMWPSLAPEVQQQIETEGRAWVPSDYGDPYLITHELICDGEKWLMLDEPFAFSGPVRILQGMMDDDVPWQHALRLVETITSDDIVITLVKDGDHRLSRDEDIQRLIDVCRKV